MINLAEVFSLTRELIDALRELSRELHKHTEAIHAQRINAQLPPQIEGRR